MGAADQDYFLYCDDTNRLRSPLNRNIQDSYIQMKKQGEKPVRRYDPCYIFPKTFHKFTPHYFIDIRNKTYSSPANIC